MFDEAFGFRGVQFGNWTNQRDRQEALNQAYDGLMDLAAATGLPARALSLNGELGLAFGARGSGSALAHYEPSTVVINLTKTKGKGSLAHEWWHALDNYFGRHSQSKGGYASEGMTDGLRSETAKAFYELQQAVKGSDYAYRSYNRGTYWGSMRELTARLFAEWVDKRGAARGEHSPFLARGVDSGLVEEYKELNWRKYQMLVTQLRRHGDTPKVMTREEFMSSPQALEGFVEVTADELATLGKYVDRLFDEMKFEERDGNTAVFEPDATYDSDNNGIGQKFVMGRGGEHSLDNQGNVASDASVDDESNNTLTGRDSNKYRDGDELSDGERMRAIRALKPVEVKRNDMSRDELFSEYRGLPNVMKNGKEVRFLRGMFGKIYRPGGLFAQAVPVLNDIFEHSVLAYSETDNLGGMERPDGTIHKSHPNVDTFDNYVGKMVLEGTEYYVRLTVQNTKDSTTGVHSCFVSGIDMYEKTASDRTDTTIFDRPNQAESGNQFSESRTIPITSRGTTDLNRIVDAKLQQFFERASAEAVKLDMHDRVEELSEKLHAPVRIVSDESELSEMSEDGKPRYNIRQRKAKGWWDGRTGEIVIVLPNNVNVADVDNTVVHEVVGHKGLRAFIGEERFDDFLREVYAHCLDSIRKRIDAQTDKMVNEEVERMRKQKRAEHEQAGEDYNSTFFADMAKARVEAEKKREAFRNEATEEYMSDLGGRIGSEGFEKMSRDELTFWGNLKARVQKFLDRFLAGLGIPKSIRLTDKDLAYILFKSWKYAKDGGKADVISEAADVAMRHRTGWDKRSVEPDWRAKTAALTDVKKSPEGKTVAPKNWRSHAEAPRYVPSHPKISDAKLEKICDNLKSLKEKIGDNGLGKSEMVYELSNALGNGGDSGRSNYSKFNISGVGETTIRISNHSAKTHNFNQTGNNVGIVIKTSNHYFRGDSGVDYVEFMYYGDKIEGNGDRQRAIVDGLLQYIETGSFMGNA